MSAFFLTGLYTVLGASAVVAALGAAVLVVKSLLDFSRTGPEIRREIEGHYAAYTVYALLRLTAWSFVIVLWLGLLGNLPYLGYVLLAQQTPSFAVAAAVAGAGILLVTALQFCHHLLHIPGGLMMSFPYRVTRLYPLWHGLSVSQLRWARLVLTAAVVLPSAYAAMETAARGDSADGLALSLLALLLAAPYLYATLPIPARAARARAPADRPNILLIGCDTLRADRLGSTGNARPTTPFLDALARRGTLFSHCYTPLARTAPSLASLFTGTWPFRHGIRTNFIADGDTRLADPSFPALLRDAGYATSAIADWAGSDLGKFPFGFSRLDAPPDQWNLKYLIRQGPRFIRLFLSLFMHNRLGRRVLPEIHYLGGVPVNDYICASAKAEIGRLARGGQPFVLNVFMATTHPPFGVEYPYYTYFSDPDYRGDSKFAMSKLSDPFEVIRRQQEPREAFDLDQIFALYDNCVRRFDDAVRDIYTHLQRCGLADNSVVVIYSDHGMELFEHNTWGQGNSVMGDSSPRVPLLICDPRLPAQGVSTTAVRTIDLMPTLLSLCGLPTPDSVQGRSLVPLLKGETLGEELPCYFETGEWLTTLPGTRPDHLSYPGVLELLDIPDKDSGTLALKEQYRDIVIAAKDRMVKLGKWKLVRLPLKDGACYALYDVEADPACRHDVQQLHPDVAARLRGLLDRWVEMDRCGQIAPAAMAANA